MSELHKVRAVALTDYAIVARSVGLDPEDMLRGVGIDPAALVDPEFRFPATAAAILLENSATLSGCDAFGILMAGRRTFGSLGAITGTLERLNSLKEVVGTASGRRRQFSDIVNISIRNGVKATMVEVGVLPGFANAQVVDLTTAMAHVLLKGASGGWKPKAVHFRHAAPRYREEFARFFEAPVHFDCAVDGFECDPDILERPWTGDPRLAAAELVESLQRELDDLAAQGDNDTVKALIATLAEIRSFTDTVEDPE